MGCASSRSELSPVEARLIRGEDELLYGTHSVTEVDFIHRKYSYNGEINENQWMNIYRNLNLALNQSATPVPDNMISYYNHFKSGNTFKLRDLLVLGILLSIGDVDTKAKLLFDAFDFETNHELNRETIGLMYDVMYRICVKRAETIAKDDEKVVVTAEEHKEYIDKLKKGKESFREKFLNNIVGDGESVTSQGFLQSFKDSKFEDILTASGFRRTLKQFNHQEYNRNA